MTRPPQPGAGALGAAGPSARVVTWTERALVATAAFLPLSIVGGQLCAGLAVLGLLAAAALGVRPRLPRELAAPVLAFVVVSLAATFSAAVDLPWRAWTAPRPALLALVVGAVFSVSPRRARLAGYLLVALVSTATFAAALGLAQRKTGFDLNFVLGLRRQPLAIPSPEGAGFSPIGTFNSRLTFSAIEAAVLLVALAVAARTPRLALRVAAGACALVIAAALLATYARAAWLGAAVGVAVLAASLERRVALALVAGLLVSATAAGLVPPVRHRAASLLRATANADRLFIWSRADEVIADNPALGVGVYGYPVVAGAYYDRKDPLFPMRTWAHDMPLTLLAETGIAGLIAWVWMFVGAVLLALRGLRSLEPPLVRTLRLAGLAGMSAVVFVSFFHDVLYDGEVGLALFFLVGLAAIPPPGGEVEPPPSNP